MAIIKKISTDMEQMMSCCKCIFSRPWDEEDCEYFFQLFFDDALIDSHCSEELERAMEMFGLNIYTMQEYLDKKESNSK